MRIIYHPPTLTTRTLQLGVFGDYGQGGGDDHEPRPIRVVNGFELRLD